MLSEESFAIARKPLKRLGVREELVLKLKLTVSNRALYENHVAAPMGGVSRATDLGLGLGSSDGDVCGNKGTAGGGRKGLSKMERKKLKKQQGQGQQAPSTIVATVTAAANTTSMSARESVPTERIVEEFCVLIRRGDDVIGDSGSERCFFIRNQPDLCESMAAVLLEFQRFQD